jgi:PAS domain-containing protein
MSPNSSRDASLDLNILEPDLVPTFVIKIGVEALPFEILYGNHRFRTGGFREAICTTELSASRFRAWTQALVFDKSHEFGGHVWVGEVAGKDGGWKVVKLPNSVPENQPQDDLSGPDSDSQPLKVSRTPTPHLPASSCMQFDDTIGSSTSIFDEYTNSDTSQDVSNVNLSAAEPSRPTSMSTSVELISSMLEIIDVGIFELGPTGRVIYANDTWYRLRCVPRPIISQDISILTV